MTIEISPRLERHLRDEKVAWLTTVRADGMPSPTPIWFVWQDGAFLLYSQPAARKLRDIARNPRVALHFNTDPTGEEFAVFLGTAHVDRDAPPSLLVPAYQAKYRDWIAMIGFTPESLALEFSVAVRVTPERVRGSLG